MRLREGVKAGPTGVAGARAGGSQALPRAGEARNRAWEAVPLQSLDRQGGAPVGRW